MSLVIILSILTALLWALSTVIDRYGVRISEKNKTWGILTVSILSMFPLFLALKLIFSVKLPDSTRVFFLYLMVGVFYFIGILFYLKAIKIAEATSVSVLFKISSIFILVGEILFLGGMFTVIEIFGMFLLLSASIIISIDSFRDIEINRAFWIMTLSGLSLALRSLVADYAVNGNPIELYVWSILGSLISALCFLIFYKKSRNQFKIVVKNYKSTKPIYVMLSKNVDGLGMLSYIIAIDNGSVSIVSFLSSLQPIAVLLIVIFTTIILGRGKEELGREYTFRNNLKTLISIIIALLGVIIINTKI